MIRSFQLTIIILMFSVTALGSGVVKESRRFSVGHHDTATIEVLERKMDDHMNWEIRYFSNGNVIAGRALTKKTYEQILKDWDAIFPDKKGSGMQCTHPIIVVKTILDGAKSQNVCSSGWSVSKKAKFKKFYESLVDFTTNKNLMY